MPLLASCRNLYFLHLFLTEWLHLHSFNQKLVSFSSLHFYCQRTTVFYYLMEQDRVELSTPALSERCSNQLSYCSKSQLKKIYIKNQLKKKRPEKPSHKNFTATVCTHTLPGNFRFPSFSFCPTKGGDPAALSSTATLLRLHPPYQAYLRQRPPCG